MPAFHVERSITIAVPRETVFSAVRDFRQWNEWSPWVIAEPDCELSYAEDGKSYAWDGKIIGAGGMEVIAEEAPASIDCDLTFLKPWKSQSKVRFEFKEAGEGTTATWTMDGSLPALMFWMKGKMTAFIGSDYDRGLAMLKDDLETGSVPSHLDFPGEEDVSGCRFLGARRECAIEEIGESMADAFGQLGEWVEEAGVTATGCRFSIYHQWDPVEGRAQYTAAIPLESVPSALPDGVIAGERAACRAYLVRHVGPYRHLGNAWAAGVMHGRAKKFSQKRGMHPFEVYLNDAGETPENELITTVHFPVK